MVLSPHSISIYHSTYPLLFSYTIVQSNRLFGIQHNLCIFNIYTSNWIYLVPLTFSASCSVNLFFSLVIQIVLFDISVTGYAIAHGILSKYLLLTSLELYCCLVVVVRIPNNLILRLSELGILKHSQTTQYPDTTTLTQSDEDDMLRHLEPHFPTRIQEHNITTPDIVNQYAHLNIHLKQAYIIISDHLAIIATLSTNPIMIPTFFNSKHFPNKFKQATLVPTPKPGKSQQEVNSYKSISLFEMSDNTDTVPTEVLQQQSA